MFDVYLKPGVDARQVQAELTKPGGWARKQAVFVERRDELRDAVNSQLERIYHLAYAQEFVVGLVALLGVVGALFISVLQRRRELGLLRAVGAAQGQILRSVLAEAALMGVVGAVLGVLIGLGLEWYTVRIMVFDEAGFVFPMLVPWIAGVAVLGGSVLAATLVGLWPACAPRACASRRRLPTNRENRTAKTPRAQEIQELSSCALGVLAVRFFTSLPAPARTGTCPSCWKSRCPADRRR